MNDVDAFILELDGNNDGVVSWSEYKNALISQTHDIEL